MMIIQIRGKLAAQIEAISVAKKIAASVLVSELLAQPIDKLHREVVAERKRWESINRDRRAKAAFENTDFKRTGLILRKRRGSPL